MNKHIRKILCMFTVSSFFLVSNSPIVKASTLINNKDKVENVSQIESKFPEEDLTSRIHARYRRTFKGYKGKGNLIITSNSIDHANIYINGNAVEVPGGVKNKKNYNLDIGKYTVDGINTIKVFNITPSEGYLDIKISYPVLTKGTPEEVGFSTEKLKKVDDLINEDVKNGFPGAVLLIVKDGKIIKNTAYGYKKKYNGNLLLKEFQEMSTDTIFDLASNTKMFATNLAMKKLVNEGKINLDEKVCKYIPGFKGDGRENITVREVLTHSAGFGSSIHFFKPETKVGPEFYSLDREKTLKLLEKVPLEYKTGTKTIYSDTGYMVLGYIIETITGEKLDDYVENNIYKPLGLKNTVYNPLRKGFKEEEFAATERNGNTRDLSRKFDGVRRYTLQGEAHDEKAYYSMDGVSGHAGLFSTTEDLAVLCQMLLNGGGYGNYKLCNKSVVEEFFKPSDVNENLGLGWNRASANKGRVWQFGPYASELAVGHTGWTGTYTCIDPKYDLGIILLTNKKHSPCPNGKFEGDKFQTGQYGSVISLIYEAFLENRNESHAKDLENNIINVAKESLENCRTTLSKEDIDLTRKIIALISDNNKKEEYNKDLNKIEEESKYKPIVDEVYYRLNIAATLCNQDDLEKAKDLVNILPTTNVKQKLLQQIKITQDKINCYFEVA